MLIKSIFTVFLFLTLFVETIFLPFPFFVLTAILFFLFYEEVSIYLIILFFSLILDRLMLYSLGSTALFLFSFFAALVLLEKIFTIRLNSWIAVGITLVGVEVYRSYRGYPFLWAVLFITIIGLLLFVWFERKVKGGKYEKKI